MNKTERVNQKSDNETAIVNKYALLILSVIDFFLLIGYVREGIVGNIPLPFMLVFVTCVVVSLVLTYAVYFKNRSSAVVKHVVMIGYAVVYALALAGARNDYVFVMAFPVAVIFVLYFDFPFILKSAAGVMLFNILYAIYFYVIKGQMPSGAPVKTASVLLQLASMAVFLFGIICTTRLSNKINAEKLDAIRQEKERTDSLLESVFKVTAAVQENSAGASELIEKLNRATGVTAQALNEISAGNTSNAESIERQIMMTGNIQEMITAARDMSEEMMTYAKASMTAVNGGKSSINDLKVQADTIDRSTKVVAESMEQLAENARKVEEITGEIFSISSQTNLLALNASIESARAGEAGRGFAVVAEQIRLLADQTRGLTENINEIVAKLQQNADHAQETVGGVIDATKQERELIDVSEESFNDIYEKMQNLNQNVTSIHGQVNQILDSNNAIVDSISQISAVSEEVAANTTEAVTLGENSKAQAEDAKRLMAELQEHTRELERYMRE